MTCRDCDRVKRTTARVLRSGGDAVGMFALAVRAFERGNHYHVTEARR